MHCIVLSEMHLSRGIINSFYLYFNGNKNLVTAVCNCMTLTVNSYLNESTNDFPLIVANQIIKDLF